MKIRVDFFRESGKWYEGGIVDIGDAKLWKGDIQQAIVDNQEILKDGWQNQDYFYVTTRDLPETYDDPEYKEFFIHLFAPHKFRGLKKQIK